MKTHISKHKRKGAIFILLMFVLIFLMIVVLACFEVSKTYSVYYEVKTQLNRLANNVVESNIDDNYRMDGFNYLNESDAVTDFSNKFNLYTGLSNGCELGTAGAVANGTRYAEDGTALYSVAIEVIETSRGLEEQWTSERRGPWLEARGKLYIAPTLNGYDIQPGVFDISIVSTNFRINDALTSTITSEGTQVSGNG